MAILSGSMSYLRFNVRGQPPNSLVENFEKALAIRRFVPLHEGGRDLESSGWVSIQKPYLDEQRLLNGYFLFGDLVVLAWREDKFVYPKAMIKDLVSKRLEETQTLDKKAVEEAVMAELRHRLLPKTKIVEMLWDLSKGQVRFFARGKSISEKFQKLFEQTFNMQIEEKTYPQIASSSLDSLRDKGMLESLAVEEIF